MITEISITPFFDLKPVPVESSRSKTPYDWRIWLLCTALASSLQCLFRESLWLALQCLYCMLCSVYFTTELTLQFLPYLKLLKLGYVPYHIYYLIHDLQLFLDVFLHGNTLEGSEFIIIELFYKVYSSCLKEPLGWGLLTISK